MPGDASQNSVSGMSKHAGEIQKKVLFHLHENGGIQGRLEGIK